MIQLLILLELLRPQQLIILDGILHELLLPSPSNSSSLKPLFLINPLKLCVQLLRGMSPHLLELIGPIRVILMILMVILMILMVLSEFVEADVFKVVAQRVKVQVGLVVSLALLEELVDELEGKERKKK